MKYIAEYDTISGRIFSVCSLSKLLPVLQHQDEHRKFIDIDSDIIPMFEKYYVSSDVALERPCQQTYIDKQNVTADDTDIITLSCLPDNAKISVFGETFTVDDGTLELTFGTPGDYKIKVECFPYLDWEETIHAS